VAVTETYSIQDPERADAVPAGDRRAGRPLV